MDRRIVYVVGCFDTKQVELVYLAERIRAAGVSVKLVDVATHDPSPAADVLAASVAAFHPEGAGAVFTGDRGTAVAGMSAAFERFMGAQDDVGGVIGLGGSGGTAIVTQGMRALPIGTPRLMVSTVASGNVSQYVGPTDITMMNSITDISGLNRISRAVLSNAANAIIGMAQHDRDTTPSQTPAIGLTMFGVTTPAVTQIASQLADQYESLVFHATGVGGQTMERLARDGFLAGVIDITTTEVTDLLFGGAYPAREDRFSFLSEIAVPYVGSCGALDMVNFGPLNSVPERYQGRNLYVHNQWVTLMRTDVQDNVKLGRWIGERLNRSIGPVRFLLPEGGVSMLDAPGNAFHDPEADAALFASLRETIVETDNRKLISLPYAINSPEFAAEAVRQFKAIAG